MKWMKKPAYIYTATMFAVALFTAYIYNLGAAMSNFKFKEGDLVEVVKSTRGNEGHRFVIGEYNIRKLFNIDGTVHTSNCNCYQTDILSGGSELQAKFTWSPESWIKRVNPDIDKISEFKFSEIMDEITEAITVEQ